MRFYAAGRFRRYAEVRQIIDDLTAMGHVVTHDWTRTQEFDARGEPRVDPGTGGIDLPDEVQRIFAEADVYGVIDCDVMVMLANDSLFGALIEFGVALAHKKPIIVIQPIRHSIFFKMPGVHVVETRQDAYDLLQKWVDEKAA